MVVLQTRVLRSQGVRVKMQPQFWGGWDAAGPPGSTQEVLVLWGAAAWTAGSSGGPGHPPPGCSSHLSSHEMPALSPWGRADLLGVGGLCQ